MVRVAILVVDRYRSECSHCGEDADPDQNRHEAILPGYGSQEEKPGCGAVFVAKMAAFYTAGVAPGEELTDFREDLPEVKHPWATTTNA